METTKFGNVYVYWQIQNIYLCLCTYVNIVCGLYFNILAHFLIFGICYIFCDRIFSVDSFMLDILIRKLLTEFRKYFLFQALFLLSLLEWQNSLTIEISNQGPLHLCLYSAPSIYHVPNTELISFPPWCIDGY